VQWLKVKALSSSPNTEKKRKKEKKDKMRNKNLLSIPYLSPPKPQSEPLSASKASLEKFT
jgi:hypothetical protein